MRVDLAVVVTDAALQRALVERLSLLPRQGLVELDAAVGRVDAGYEIATVLWDRALEGRTAGRTVMERIVRDLAPRWVLFLGLGEVLGSQPLMFIGDVMVSSSHRRVSSSTFSSWPTVEAGEEVLSWMSELATRKAVIEEMLEPGDPSVRTARGQLRNFTFDDSWVGGAQSLPAPPARPRIWFGGSASFESMAVARSLSPGDPPPAAIVFGDDVGELIEAASSENVAFAPVFVVRGSVGWTRQDNERVTDYVHRVAASFLDAVLFFELIPRRAPTPQKSTMSDRITRLVIEGVRTIDRLELDLEGVTVLIGENGVGKSTVVEICEILRRAGFPEFLTQLNRVHGGLFSILRKGAPFAAITASIEGDGSPLEYRLELTHEGGGAIAAEQLLVGHRTDESKSAIVLKRNYDRAVVYRRLGMPPPPGAIDPGQTALAILPAGAHPAIERARRALASIDVHLPFEVLASWAARESQRSSVTRNAVLIQPASRLERYGANLANAYHALRNDYSDEHWQTTLEYIQLGVPNVVNVVTRADLAGGAIALGVQFRMGEDPLPAHQLADGVLAYLAFIALFRLATERSLLVFDEPDLHLHPALIGRVVDFFESSARRFPVIVATQSDRFLDALRDPAKAVRACELSDAGTMVARKLGPDALSQWLERFRGVGELRSAGYLPLLLAPEEG